MMDPKDRAKILKADFANIVRKVKAGKPLSKAERDLMSAEQQPEPTPREPVPTELSVRVADSMEHAVAILKSEGFPDINKALVRKLKKDPAFKSAFKGSRVLLDQFIPALRARVASDAAPDPQSGQPQVPNKENLEIRKLLAQCEKLEFEVGELKKKYVLRADVVKSNRRLAGELKKLYRRSSNEGPAAVAGKDTNEAREWFARNEDQNLRTIQSWENEWPE